VAVSSLGHTDDALGSDVRILSPQVPTHDLVRQLIHRMSAVRDQEPALPTPATVSERLTRRRFNARLFRWHAHARRPLLIREASTPWDVLVAEVMSQQTGVDRVGPVWRRFIDRWPTPADLAVASTHDLLAAWAGLGYNRRALSLRATARTIVADHGGRVPETVEVLQRLPGIGPYTSRAVAAAAFGVPVAPLDVNVRRVVSRVLGEEPTSRGFQALADSLVARGQPGRWIDAIMDLASGTCTPRAPRCDACPVASICASHGTVPAARQRVRGQPFPKTTRWLRGRLVALLTEAPAGTWVELPRSLGEHDVDAIADAALGLERDGIFELSDRSARIRA
jgi:A/G-specific adenine glycosylase